MTTTADECGCTLQPADECVAVHDDQQMVGQQYQAPLAQQ